MKWFSLVLIIVTISCKKSSDALLSSQPLQEGLLLGSWELRQTEGNIPVKDYPVGNGSIITFTQNDYHLSDSMSILFYIGNFSKEGNYYSVTDTTAQESVGLLISPGQFASRLIINNDTATRKIFYQVSGNQLTIISGYFPTDGGVKNTYERLPDHY